MSAHTFFAVADDESACSILKMVSQTTNIPEARRVYVRCVQQASPMAGSLPCRASRFCAITENSYGSPRDVLDNYSLAGWNAIGMTPAEREGLMQSLIEGHSWSKCPRFDPLCQCGNRTELQCPECARLDETRFGRQVNHTTHCISYVSRCVHHDLTLESVANGSRLEALLIRPDAGAARMNSTKYALVATALAQREAGSLEVWPEITARLRERRYISVSGKWKMTRLRSDFQSFFSHGFEDPRLTHITNVSGYLLAAIRSGVHRRPVHPAMVTLLWVFSSEADVLPGPASTKVRSAHVAAKEESEVEAHRAAWLEVCRQHPGKTRTAISKLAPALRSWLYRNDRQWLVNHQVPKTFHLPAPPKPKQAPEAVKQTIANFTDDLRCSFKGREPLPSAYQVRLAYGMRPYAFDRLAKEFGGVGLDAEVPGSKHIFVARRAGCLTGANPIDSDVLSEGALSRLSGLEAHTLRKYLRRG